MSFDTNTTELTVKEASVLASKVTAKRFTTENIHYLDDTVCSDIQEIGQLDIRWTAELPWNMVW